MSRLSRTCLLVAMFAIGCEVDVERPTEVNDLRVLAVRAEPPELLLEADAENGGLRVAGGDTVTLQALVVDPRGGVLSWSWQVCPIDVRDLCAELPATLPAVEPALRERLTTAAAQAGHGGAVLQGLEALPTFAARFEAGIGQYHLGKDGLGGGNGAWPGAILQVRRGDETLAVQKRVVLNLRDPAAMAEAMKAVLGVEVCPAPPAPAPPGCLPLRPRVANANPALAGVMVARSERADAAFTAIDLTAPLPVRAGESLRLLPVLAEGAEQSYQWLDAELADNRLVVSEKRESAVVSWFASAGELDGDRTSVLLTRTLDNVYTAPVVPPAGGAPVVIWMVVRDQRGGVGWQRLLVQVTP